MPWVGKKELEAGYPVDSWVPIPQLGLYKPEYDLRAFQYCKLGAINSELADFFGIAPQTVCLWQANYASFNDACVKGWEEGSSHRNARVQAALYNRAVGYTHESVKFFCYEGKIVAEPYKEHVPPDVAACKFWMVNNHGWTDKLTHAGDPNNPIKTETEVSVLTSEEIKERLRERGLPETIFDK